MWRPLELLGDETSKTLMNLSIHTPSGREKSPRGRVGPLSPDSLARYDLVLFTGHRAVRVKVGIGKKRIEAALLIQIPIKVGQKIPIQYNSVIVH